MRIAHYFSINSPWSYLGHERFRDIVRRYGAMVVYKPLDPAKVFPVSGGLPLNPTPASCWPGPL